MQSPHPAVMPKPYLVRAIYQWAVENNLTPHILVDATCEEVEVPGQYVTDGSIIINIHPQSVQGLELGNEYILCSARFSGRIHDLTVPVDSVMAIYARETGTGIVLAERNLETVQSESRDDLQATVPDDAGQGRASRNRGRPQLRRIK